MRDKFKKALLHIILGPFTATNGLLWSAYKDYLRDIDPNDLPKKVQPLFEELKGIYEKRFEAYLDVLMKWWEGAELRSNGMNPAYRWWDNNNQRLWVSGGRLGDNWYDKTRKPNFEEIYQHSLDADIMHNTQHVTAKRIKELMFEIIEKLPKRVRKKALAPDEINLVIEEMPDGRVIEAFPGVITS
jgi:hypothetical protein